MKNLLPPDQSHITPLLRYSARNTIKVHDAVTVQEEKGTDKMIFITSLEITLNLFHATGLIL